jgi:YbbR domain-containing protein
MQQRPSLRKLIFDNVLWFIGSLILAVFVWTTAMTQADPISQWRLAERIPIQFLTDEGLIVIGENESNASVQLRAQQSVRQLFSIDDVQVVADLQGLAPGSHTIPLQVRIANGRRVSVLSTSPRQVSVTLEVRESQLKPVEMQASEELPLVYQLEGVTFDPLQATVSGAASRVNEVVAVRVPLDLSSATASFETDVSPVPVNVDGVVVEDVTVEPALIQTSVNISQRSDVREVRVSPNIVGEVPEGYILSAFDYEPKSIVVSGPTEALAALPGTISTEPIDLSQHTASFELTVPVELPDSSLVVVTGRTITISIGIVAPTITRQYDRIPVEVVGLRPDLQVDLLPNEVTVLVTGPEPTLIDLTADELRVVIDASALLTSGSYQLEPTASLMQVNSQDITLSAIPDVINVQVIAPEATAEVTAQSP